ncbi:MAG: NAD-dependent epimerase/dehydratase family protein [Anaerolineales bacterium]|nr:NAD-dependent epimerase/dehydratase family protein [Anaerolineales bacterium]
MKTAFVTGGTGFIGSRLIALLVARGVEVRALARSQAGLEKVKTLGAAPVQGDVIGPKSMKEALRGCDVVFHVASMYEVGLRYKAQMEKVNVDGVRNVIETALEAGVPKIVFTGTVGVFGDTRGRTVDETYEYKGNFSTVYERTKWIAHYQVVQPFIRQGAPIIIVMPSAVFGPNDHSTINDLMKLHLRGRLPAVPGKETTFSYVYVDDIAEGHILAAEKGRIGEAYILSGTALPMGEFVKLWSKVTGRPAPALEIPSAFLRVWWPVLGLLERVLPIPAVLSGEAARVLGTTWIATSEKAQRELGYRPRPLEEGLKLTFDWLNNQYNQK